MGREKKMGEARGRRRKAMSRDIWFHIYSTHSGNQEPGKVLTAALLARCMGSR